MSTSNEDSNSVTSKNITPDKFSMKKVDGITLMMNRVKTEDESIDKTVEAATQTSVSTNMSLDAEIKEPNIGFATNKSV